MEDKLWSKSLKERIEAEKYLSPSELDEIKLSRLKRFGFSNDRVVPEGDHFRLNSFWLFIGLGNSSSELWNQLPRKDITLGEPHLFEEIYENDERILEAVYHRQIRSLLEVVNEQGYVQERIPKGLSYQYVGNLNISDIVAKNELAVIGGKTQVDDLKNTEKILMLINLIKTCVPAFVVTHPQVFKIFKKHFKLKLVKRQSYKRFKGEIYTCDNLLPQTIFIRLPNHISICGKWRVTKELILESVRVAAQNEWRGIS